MMAVGVVSVGTVVKSSSDVVTSHVGFIIDT